METLSQTLRRIAAGLAAFDFDAVTAPVLEAAGQAMQDSVTAAISHAPDSGEHVTPWERSGRLAGSIGHSVADGTLIVGATDPVAVYQEMGTHTIPPRPFLAPVAAEQGESVAGALGEAVAAAIGGEARA
jgi:phage gpG-like protein